MAKRKFSEEQTEYMIKMRSEGMLIKDIASIMGCCPKTARRYLDPEVRERGDAYSNDYQEKNRARIAARQSKYAQENKERLNEYSREWAAENRDKRKVITDRWRHNNNDKIVAAGKRYNAENKEMISAKRAIYRKENKEMARISSAKWHEKNPGKKRAWSVRRRALEKEATIGSLDEINEIYRSAKEDEGIVCYLCGKVIEKGCGHVDHVFPLSKGGAHTASNLRATHANCNMKKHDTILEPILLNPGDRVIDREGDIGTVVNSDDPHNVQVHYDNGGSSINCIVPECESFEGLWPEGVSEK